MSAIWSIAVKITKAIARPALMSPMTSSCFFKVNKISIDFYLKENLIDIICSTILILICQIYAEHNQPFLVSIPFCFDKTITIHTDDLAVVNCLHSLSQYFQKTGNNHINWEATQKNQIGKQLIIG